MGKTKTAVITGKAGAEVTGKEAYEKKKREKEGGTTKVPGMGGGERIQSVEGEIIETEETTPVRKRGQDGRGKAYKNAKSKVDPTKLYKTNDAVKLVKEMGYSKFDSTVELHLVVKKEGISESVTLPHSTGKSLKVEVADDKTLEKLKSGKVDFDVLLATADMMPKLVPFAKLLGPRGLMPNPKAGTLIKDKKDAEKFNADKVQLKTEKKAPLIHTTVGKTKLEDKKLAENTDAVLDAIGRRRIERAYLSASMTPSVKIDLNG